MATLLVVICLLLSHHLVIAIEDPNTVQLDRTADILRTTTTNTEQCSDVTSGCIPGDTVEGTDCTDSTVCRTMSADYCGGVFGTPTRRVCCKSRGTTTTTTTTDTDTVGCPVENRGCLYSDKVEGTDCTTGGSDTCRTMGADYCSAMVGTRRVCCMVTRTTTPEFTATTDEQCPDWNHGCIFTDHVNGTDCTNGGTSSCQLTTTDGRMTTMNTFTTTAMTHSTDTTATTMMTTRTIAAYCSAKSGTDRRRVCCHTHLYTTNTPMTTTTTSNTPTATATTTITEFTDTHMEGRTACPAKTSGCIYTDRPTTTDCTTGGSAFCLSTGADYCSSLIRGKRVCCTVTTTTTTRPTTTTRTTSTTTDTTTDRCPRENSGCIMGDTVDGTDCSMTGSAGCVTVGADYCSATIGNRRVCCKATGKTTKTDTTMTKTTTDPDTAGCPGTNFGCLFDDQAMTGTDCTTDHTMCKQFGTDYCGAMVNGKRVCCRTTVMPRPKMTDTTDEQCPEWNEGCIFSDTVNGTDCTTQGNTVCTSGVMMRTTTKGTIRTNDRMTTTVLNSYCSAPSTVTGRRVCCHVNPMPTTMSVTTRMPKTTETTETTTTTQRTDPTKACPKSNGGCIWTDRATGIDCTTGGHLTCKASETDYCSAFVNGRRTCCTTTTTTTNTDDTTTFGDRTSTDTKSTTDNCPKTNDGCIVGHTTDGTDCTTLGSRMCRAVGAEYCGAVFVMNGTPKRMCCKTTTTTTPDTDDTTRGCPMSNLGCIFDHTVSGNDCTTGGGSECRKRGSDYCSAAMANGTRVCCDATTSTTRTYTRTTDEGCPVANAGCIFDDMVHGFDCTTGGDRVCDGVDADYCSAYFGFPTQRRVCCMVRGAPRKTMTTTTTIDSRTACPSTNHGCMFDDEPVTDTDCTFEGTTKCTTTGSHYCSAFVGGKRTCCKVRENESN